LAAAKNKPIPQGFSALEFSAIFLTVVSVLLFAILRFNDSVKRSRAGLVKKTLNNIVTLESKYFKANNNYGTLGDIHFIYPYNDQEFEYSVISAENTFVAMASEKEGLDPLGNGITGDQMLSIDHTGHRVGW